MIRVSTVPGKAALQNLPLRVTIEATVEEWEWIAEAFRDTKSYRFEAQHFVNHISAALRQLREALTQFSAEGGSDE